MGADQSAVRSTAPGLEISSVIRAIRACRVHSLTGGRRGPRHILSRAPSKAYGLHKRHGATWAIPSTSHERCRDPPTGVQSCHEHMLMRQDWGKEPLLQAVYASRLLGLEEKTEVSLWMENEWKLRKTWSFRGSWLQFALHALQSCDFSNVTYLEQDLQPSLRGVDCQLCIISHSYISYICSTFSKN